MLKKSNKIRAALSFLLVMCTVFSFLSVSDVGVYAENAPRVLCPGGMPFGLEIETSGVLVVGFDKVDTEKGNVSPAEISGIKIKDVIISLDGKSTSSALEICEKSKESNGKTLHLEVLRNGEVKKIDLVPERSVSKGEYRAGVVLRDKTAGIGTVTFIDTETGRFGGLGHGICDSDTGALLPVGHGEVYRAMISSVKIGKSGAPGELHGYFEKKVSGNLVKNTDQGVFGTLDTESFELAAPIEVASINEIREGEALIYSTVSSDGIGAYKIRITGINSKSKTKNFSIEVIDKTLISKTGGIVQGMSGSPIIQNGKLVGAITHVTVNDPTKGYGIFIENMMNAAEMQMPKAA